MDRELLTDHLYQGSYEEPLAISFGECSVCSNAIYEGDDYYNINHQDICEDCIGEFKKVAEIESK